MLRARRKPGLRRVGVALLCALALLGFAAAYPLTSGSRAAVAGSTTVPSPELPPPPPPKPERPPPPPPQPQPPPPPPPAPVRSYVAPPPPVSSRSRATVAPKPKPVHPRPHVRRTHEKVKRAKKHAIAPAAPQAPPRNVSVAATHVASVAGAPEGSRSAALKLLFGSALVILLLGFALAVAPRAVLPGPLSEVVELHREFLLTLLSAVALGVAIGLGLVVLS